MEYTRGMILSKDEFLQDSLYSHDGIYAKEEYEGLLVASDIKRGLYNIGIKLGDNQVVVVDQVRDDEVQDKVHQLMPKIQEIQRQYRAKNDLEYMT